MDEQPRAEIAQPATPEPAELTPDQLIEFDQALQEKRALHIVGVVKALAPDDIMPKPYWSGWYHACEEIAHRLEHEKWELSVEGGWAPVGGHPAANEPPRFATQAQPATHVPAEPPPLPAGEVMASGVVGGMPVSLVRYTEADIRRRDGWWQYEVQKAQDAAKRERAHRLNLVMELERALEGEPSICSFPEVERVRAALATKEAGTQLDALRAAVEELARDAERWRFVGDYGNDFGVLRLASHGEWVHVTEAEIDAAIDRARNALKESGHE